MKVNVILLWSEVRECSIWVQFHLRTCLYLCSLSSCLKCLPTSSGMWLPQLWWLGLISSPIYIVGSSMNDPVTIVLLSLWIWRILRCVCFCPVTSLKPCCSKMQVLQTLSWFAIPFLGDWKLKCSHTGRKVTFGFATRAAWRWNIPCAHAESPCLGPLFSVLCSGCHSLHCSSGCFTALNMLWHKNTPGQVGGGVKPLLVPNQSKV